MAYTLSMKTPRKSIVKALSYLAGTAMLTGCSMGQDLGQLQQRRVDLPVATGADESLDDRFGLTDDAQDPHKRDEEMGYGRWKAKPETEGTLNPTSPGRRGNWTGSP